jgi:hypothetical protein
VGVLGAGVLVPLPDPESDDVEEPDDPLEEPEESEDDEPAATVEDEPERLSVR